MQSPWNVRGEATERIARMAVAAIQVDVILAGKWLRRMFRATKLEVIVGVEIGMHRGNTVPIERMVVSAPTRNEEAKAGTDRKADRADKQIDDTCRA